MGRYRGSLDTGARGKEGRPMKNKKGRRRERDPPGKEEGIYSHRRRVFHPAERHGEHINFLGRRGTIGGG